jgi:predicted permease
MPLFAKIRTFARNLFSTRGVEADLDREINSHLQMLAEENIRAGMSSEEAVRTAHLQFGGAEQVKEEVRDARLGNRLHSVFADGLYGLRQLRKYPGFTFVAILTLGVCIGANTAIFSVVDAVVIRPLSYRDAGRLVAIHEVIPKFSNFAPLLPINAMHFREWQKNAHSFDQLNLLDGRFFTLTDRGEPERIPGARVSSGIFSTLGVQPQLGRTFRLDEDAPGHDQVVIISHGLWVRRFNADPRVIGRHIQLDDRSYEIIGVLPADFHFPRLDQLFAMRIVEARPEIWKPFALRDDELSALGDFNYSCIARLKPGVSIEQARAELDLIQADISQRMPEKIELYVKLVPLQKQITSRARAGLELLLAATGIVLLIGCVNVANLIVTHAVKRRHEMAVRAAMGANGGRLTQQMFVESLLLSTFGGIAGVFVAYFGMRFMLANIPFDLPRTDEVHLNVLMLLFTLAVSTITGVLCAILPAWYITKIDPLTTMKSGTRGATSGSSVTRLRSILVGVETALSAACLIMAGLLLHSLLNVLCVDGGFQAEHVVTAELNLPDSHYPDLAKNVAFTDALLARVKTLPGVVATGVSSQLPLGGEGGNNVILAEGVDLPLLERPVMDIRNASPGYFATMGIPLKMGRVFADKDRGRNVALISDSAAERIWPGQNVIGKRFQNGDKDEPWMEIIGVVGDIRGISLDKNPTPTIYLPYWERFKNEVSLVVRASAALSVIAPEIRNTIRESDAQIPVTALQTMQEIVSTSVAPQRFQSTLVLTFALAAALLAGLGIYGVVAFSTAQRTNEIGIRIAMGAQRGNIANLVFGQALLPVGGGLVAGVLLALAFGRLLSASLFEVGLVDPATVVGVVCFLGIIAVAAIYLPFRQAMSVDPIVALRYE